MEAFVFSVIGAPHPVLRRRAARKLIDSIKDTGTKNGMICVYPYRKKRTIILAFRDLNGAKRARNELRSAGYTVGAHILNAEADETKKCLTILDTAED